MLRAGDAEPEAQQILEAPAAAVSVDLVGRESHDNRADGQTIRPSLVVNDRMGSRGSRVSFA